MTIRRRTLLPLPGKLNFVHPWSRAQGANSEIEGQSHLYRPWGSRFFHPVFRIHWGSHEFFALVGTDLVLRSGSARSGKVVELA